MPYIHKNLRGSLRVMVGRAALNPGELNFSFTTLINHYVRAKGLSYQTINDIIGSLEGAKLEFYRRIAVPYEDSKIYENGDVYDRI